MTDFELRPITPEELKAYAAVVGVSFGWMINEEDLDFWEKLIEMDRTLAVYENGQMVGTAAGISFQWTLPGPVTAPVAGVTAVTVLPTHRRRGVLSSMMRRQLEDFRERGESIAILLASESIIYGRFGYGLATTQVGYEIDRAFGAFRREYDAPGTVSFVEKEPAASMLPPIYERVRLRQPGFIDRSDAWWEVWLKDPERDRNGASARFYVVYERDGEAQGYLAYRIKSDWHQGIARNEVRVTDLMTVTPDAYVALWRYCMNMDLAEKVSLHSRPVDEPARWMLADTRRLRFGNVSDHLWARLVDIPSALESRRYQTEGATSFAVVDPFCPENNGTYRLEGGPAGATCRRVDAEPDLALAVDDLGAAFLGGVSFRTLARAGRIEERTPGAIKCADAMFASDIAPWCANEF